MSGWLVTVLKDLLLLTKDGEWGKGEPAEGLSEMSGTRGADMFPRGPRAQFAALPACKAKAESAKPNQAGKRNLRRLEYGG